jgi:putative ABC transport system permease protein
LIAAITQDVHELDKDLPVSDVTTLQEVLSHEASPKRLNAGLLSLFAALALTLAAIGVYGVTAYSVAQRTHEVGIRMAIGAQGRDVMKMFLRDGVRLVLIGLVIGLGGAMALTRLIQSLLFGVSAMDATTFVLAAAGLFVVALLACYIPARRATKVDPLIALRYE